jgi:hypothetical protein
MFEVQCSFRFLLLEVALFPFYSFYIQINIGIETAGDILGSSSGLN